MTRGEGDSDSIQIRTRSGYHTFSLAISGISLVGLLGFGFGVAKELGDKESEISQLKAEVKDLQDQKVDRREVDRAINDIQTSLQQTVSRVDLLLMNGFVGKDSRMNNRNDQTK